MRFAASRAVVTSREEARWSAEPWTDAGSFAFGEGVFEDEVFCDGSGIRSIPSSKNVRYLLVRATVLLNSCGPEYPPCSSKAIASRCGNVYPSGNGLGLRFVVLPTITPSTPLSHTASQMPATCSSESSSGDTLTITAGFILLSVFFAASTTPVSMFVRGPARCNPRRPGVLGLDLPIISIWIFRCMHDQTHTFTTRISAYRARASTQ